LEEGPDLHGLLAKNAALWTLDGLPLWRPIGELNCFRGHGTCSPLRHSKLTVIDSEPRHTLEGTFVYP
jgi:hypothetical protein